jgi:predicted dinucleotide-utilizing enzyme
VAARACNHLLPNGGSDSQETAQQKRTRLADGRSFARCMRSHGLTRFPDPTAQGDLSVEMVQAQGIDVHSPAVLRVVQACLPASHGALTPAKVREALNNAGS